MCIHWWNICWAPFPYPLPPSPFSPRSSNFEHSPVSFPHSPVDLYRFFQDRVWTGLSASMHSNGPSCMAVCSCQPHIHCVCTQRQQIYDVKNNNKRDTRHFWRWHQEREFVLSQYPHNGPGRLLMRFHTGIIVVCIGLVMVFGANCYKLLYELCKEIYANWEFRGVRAKYVYSFNIPIES